jgi:hypothetical protein
MVTGSFAMRRDVMPESPRPQLFVDLLGTPWRQGPAQGRTDLGLADIELMGQGQDPGVVPVPGTPGLPIVQTRNQGAVDEHRRDGLLADPVVLRGVDCPGPVGGLIPPDRRRWSRTAFRRNGGIRFYRTDNVQFRRDVASK